jgi:hypothetical protein
MKKKLLMLLMLLTLHLSAFETIVESEDVHYNGECITLIGRVSVENSMGKLTAERAILKKDENKQTKIDFPWIELKHSVCLTLADGGTLQCDSVFLDYTQMTGFLYGCPQLIYKGDLGEIYADRAQVDYQEIDGKLEATKVTLYENVHLVNMGSEEKPGSQYALADEVTFFPQEQLTILESKNGKVLFYDKQRDMQLSARKVRAQRDPLTKKESVQGIGDVRFVFGPEELEKIKQRFPGK